MDPLPLVSATQTSVSRSQPIDVPCLTLRIGFANTKQVPGEEEDDDALIEDDADEDNEADSPSEGRISKKPRLG
eukprot:m.210589 g.210589  ORF g.210589 m.210589 type:complete len:74 (-) comp19011_c2_seq5:471-692(-)